MDCKQAPLFWGLFGCLFGSVVAHLGGPLAVVGALCIVQALVEGSGSNALRLGRLYGVLETGIEVLPSMYAMPQQNMTFLRRVPLVCE